MRFTIVLNQVEHFKCIIETEVEAFAKIFFKPEDENFEKLQPILEEIAATFCRRT